MINRLKVSNYLGIEAREFTFGPGGAIIEGANRKGKTSVLEAIRAALTGRGCSPDAIRIGAERAEIVVDLDDLSVRRLITKDAARVTVKRSDGMSPTKPQTFLTELLGVAPLDPIDLVFEKDPKKQRATILAAMPVTVTIEQLKQWLPAGDVVSATDVEGHGIEAIGRLRAVYYDRRTDANKAYKTSHEEAERLAEAAKVARYATTGDETAAVVLDTMNDDPEEHLAACRKALADAEADLRAVADNAAKTSKLRARVQALRDESREILASAIGPTPEQKAEALKAQEDAYEDCAKGEATVAQLERDLEAARRYLHGANAKLDKAKEDVRRVARAEADVQAAIERSTEREHQALELDETIAELDTRKADSSPARERERVEMAERVVALMNLRNKACVVEFEAKEAAARAERAKSTAFVLDQAVKKLSDDAPAELIAKAGGVPGLTVDADHVYLNGVALHHLSGAEQLGFAVEIARRLNAKSKLIVCDGLEALDVEELPRFLELATRDGYQLIGTRVGVGEPRSIPIGEPS